MSEQDDKPNGWVAMNAELFSFCAKVYSSWLDAAFSADLEGNIYGPQDSLDVIACKLAEAGWRIRPVRLVFLDEVEK